MRRGVLALLLLVCPASLAQAQWTNEPPGSTRVVDCGFAVANCVGQYTRGTWLDIYQIPRTSDGSAPQSPPSVADAALIHPNTSGGGDLGWWDNRADREIYMGAYFKFTAGGSSIPGFTKIFFLRSLNARFGNTQLNGVFYIGGRDATSRQMLFGHNTSGLDNLHSCGPPYGELCYPNVGTGTFAIGQWVKFEACIRGSTTATSRDGVLRWWLNGVPAGDFRTMNYGPNVNEAWWSQTWDGDAGLNGKGFSGDVHQYVDHMVVSIPPDGGCGGIPSAGGGGASPPPPPPLAPNKPTNLRVQ